MKTKILVLGTLFLGLNAWAQKMGLKLEDNIKDDTSITVRKGQLPQGFDERRVYEIVTLNDSIEGDPGYDPRTARSNWSKACKEWRQELKEGGNQVIGVPGCGKVTVVKEGDQYIGRSDVNAKVRVRMTEEPSAGSAVKKR